MTLDATLMGARAPQAAATAHLFARALVLCGVILLLVVALIGVCLVRFRESSGRSASVTDGNRFLEIGWTLAPLAVLIWLLVSTSHAMAVVDPPIDRSPDLTIIAHQWWWEVRYPSGAVTANEIHIPTGRPLVARVESLDVVHDFWVPALGRKVDAIPGRPTNIWIQANEPGTYLGTCAEFCGAEHAWMRIRVTAELPEAFATWERHEASAAAEPIAPAAAHGLEVFRSNTCITCHAVRGIDDAHVAPDLTHVARRETLGAGVLDNSPAQLTRWLEDPQGIKAGCHMPNGHLSAGDLRDVVSYLETLR